MSSSLAIEDDRAAGEAQQVNRPIRVLHVIQNLNYGGMERLMADLVRRLDPRRFESHVLVLQYVGRFASEMDGCAVVHQAPRQGRFSILWPRTLVREIARIRPDVVHSHSGVWYKASLAARIAGVPRVIHTDHGRQSPDPRIARLLDGLASRWTACVIAVSEPLREQLRATVVADAKRVCLILNGVDTDRHRPRLDTGRVRGELGIPMDAPVIGSIGRLEPIKGYETMVEAFAELSRQHAGSGPHHMVIAGDGSERARLEALARTLDVADRVHWLGWRDDVEDLHACFSLFSMSSWSEGTSISLLEAMSAGLCPIVTDVGGNRGVLGRDLSHRLVPAGDASGLAGAWSDALNDPHALAADATAARTRVLADYSLDFTVKAYEDLYSL